jgi:hypothetical protein
VLEIVIAQRGVVIDLRDGVVLEVPAAERAD